MPAPEALRREAGTVARFGLAGIANTVFGLAVILGLELGLGVERHLANAGGYAAGAFLGLVLHRRFVFVGEVAAAGLKTRYVVALLIAFAVNQGVLTAGALVLPPDGLGRSVAQLGALASYTATQFLLMRLWVFRSRSWGAVASGAPRPHLSSVRLDRAATGRSDRRVASSEDS